MIFKKIKSYNFSKKPRKIREIKFIILHYTGMQSKRASIQRLIEKKNKVSCHYLIDRNGEVTKMVEDQYVAWHAGKSRWKNFKNLNENSIGIELVNKGHTINYQKFPKMQIDRLIQVCLNLKKKYKIKNKCILGHSDIAPLRKIDPGEKFPWQYLSKKKISIWHSELTEKYDNIKKKKIRNLFFKSLYKIGYRYFDKSRASKKDKYIIKAFQSRFRPSKINGQIDKKTFKISHFLASKF
ncbi:N-acetylmuramoyl-L-alanine amidase [Pelagibacteraceae bacterium]|nr:N-acetylmuramoyl-L-alanine amidase [Pelagibacteraceae bacterium]